MIRLGTRGHDIGVNTAEELAGAMKSSGFEGVQLVPYKSIIGVSDKSGFLNKEIARRIGKDFFKNNIKIEIIGSYFNLLDQNEKNLEEGIKRFCEYLKYAKEFGTNIVGTETGSYNSDWSYNEKNHSEEAYQKALYVIKKMVLEAEKYEVNIGIEGVWAHTVNTPEKLKKLINDINSPNLKVIFDPINFLNPNEPEKLFEIIEKSFKYFGDRIEVIHAKDCVIENNEKKNVKIGKGIMDYPRFIKFLEKEKEEISIIIEELQDEDLIEAKNYLDDIIK